MSAEGTRGDICHVCNLCCDGTFFGNGRLQSGEVERARKLGLPLLTVDDAPAFAIPCTRHDGHGCSVYDDRPQVCRDFRCRLLNHVDEGKVAATDAEGYVARVRELSEVIRNALTSPAPHQSLFIVALDLTKRADDPDWRRDNAELLMDIGELVHIARRRFGIRDDGRMDGW